MDITGILRDMSDDKYRDFQSVLIPSIEKETVLGVRMPQIRKLAKTIITEDAEVFMNSLPHRYYDENQLHAVLISGIADFDRCIENTEKFVGYIDNWATCDTMSPKVFSKNKEELLKHIVVWIDSDHTYTVRFAIKMLMEHFLGESYSDEYPQMVARVKSEEYYVKMMIAWYFATALSKQWDLVFPYIKSRKLSVWIHNKTIQKALESYRITSSQKDILRRLKIK